MFGCFRKLRAKSISSNLPAGLRDVPPFPLGEIALFITVRPAASELWPSQNFSARQWPADGEWTQRNVRSRMVQKHLHPWSLKT
jgi:hypothetical protein